jgi:hypothetical protein
MTVYTFWGNVDEHTDGTSVLFLRSGPLPIGESADFTDSEYSFFINRHILIPGSVPWSRTDFPWPTGTGVVNYGTSGGGSGGGGGGPTYTWKTPGVSTASALSSTGNARNDATLVRDTGSLYAWDGSTWQLLATFGSVGGGGSLPSTISGGDPTTTSFTAILDGGNPSTTSFTQVISGGTP